MAGHVMNFFRGVRKAKELIGQGVIGDILYCHGARNAWEGTGASETWKKTRSKSGGHLYTISMSWTASSSLWGAVLKQ